MFSFISRFFALTRAHVALAAASAVLITFAAPAGIRSGADSAAGSKAAGDDLKAVRVTTRREGEQTHFVVENMEYCEVTMTFDMNLVHLKGDVQFPYTATFPPRQVTDAFTLSPSEPGAKWEYSFTNHFKLGSNCVKHDDSAVYLLPYSPGAKYTVTQGYNGDFSHKGANQYAIDWKMPEGTLVRAARGGTVVKVKDDSSTGGSSLKYDKYNNYVLIRHDDGTLAHYCHLQKNGIVVKIGQTVAAGDPIAHSGNTGFSSGPHLHFCVFKTKNGLERESLPVKFRTSDDYAATLVESRKYRAIALPPIFEARDTQPDTAKGSAQGAVIH